MKAFLLLALITLQPMLVMSMECSNLEAISFQHNYEGCSFQENNFGTFMEDDSGLTLVLNCYREKGGFFTKKRMVLDPIEKSVQRRAFNGGMSSWDGQEDTYYTQLETQDDTITLSTWRVGSYGRENHRISEFKCID